MANVRQYNNFVTASEVIANAFTNQATDTALISDSILDIAELAHIKPELGFEVMNEIQYNTTSAGLVVNVSEFSNPANVEQFNQMKSDTYRKAKVFLDDMIAYITHEDQVNQFPLYGTDGDSSMPDQDIASKLNGIIFY